MMIIMSKVLGQTVVGDARADVFIVPSISHAP